MSGSDGSGALSARSGAGRGPTSAARPGPAAPAVPGRSVLPPGRAPEPPAPPRVPGRSISAAPLRPAAAPEPARREPAPAPEPARRAAPSRRTPATASRSDGSASEAPRRRREKVEVPASRLVYLSVGEAARRSGASASSVRAWVRTGQVRTRTGSGARGDRLEVALGDVEAVLARRAAAVREVPAAAVEPEPEPADRSGGALALPAATSPGPQEEPAGEPRPARRPRRPRQEAAARRQEDGVNPDAQLVPMTTVEAMERLSGELYLAGQRAARAEAVAELRERRLADLQQEVDDLQREATALWEQNQELLRRVALAEAQLEARSAPAPAAAGPGDALRWRLRR